ncbi:hypothetical protein Y1Q_0000702 [Alligator mississippiensis]|uniref:Uncharacterized protein n=1 Tax=Alligator mississippiensis TaxID=8496 RepID=A0A151MC51_ALLMI|nr:hypothetical protein Y1Q_0000702 [Alligator mississippiensis]
MAAKGLAEKTPERHPGDLVPGIGSSEAELGNAPVSSGGPQPADGHGVQNNFGPLLPLPGLKEGSGSPGLPYPGVRAGEMRAAAAGHLQALGIIMEYATPRSAERIDIARLLSSERVEALAVLGQPRPFEPQHPYGLA